MREKRKSSALEEDDTFPYCPSYYTSFEEAIVQSIVDVLAEEMDQYIQNITDMFDDLIAETYLQEDQEDNLEDDLEDIIPQSNFFLEDDIPKFPVIGDDDFQETARNTALNHPNREQIEEHIQQRCLRILREKINSEPSERSCKRRKSSISLADDRYENVTQQRQAKDEKDATVERRTSPNIDILNLIRQSVSSPLERVFRTSTFDSINPFEQNVEKGLLQFMNEMPLGRTILPSRFCHAEDLEDESIIRESSSVFHRNTGTATSMHDGVLTSSPIVAATPGAIQGTPGQPLPRPAEKSPNQTKSPMAPMSVASGRVKQLIHQIEMRTPIRGETSGYTLKSAKRLSKAGRMVIVSSINTPNIPRPRNSSSSLFRSRPSFECTPSVQPKGNLHIDAQIRSVSTSKERDTGQDSLDQDQGDERPTPQFLSSYENDEVTKSSLSRNDPVPHSHSLSDEEVPMPLSQEITETKGPIKGSRSTENDMSDDIELQQCVDDASMQHIGNDISEMERRSQQQQEALTLHKSLSPIDIRQRCLSMDPNVTDDALKHQDELGLERTRRGLPEDVVDILYHPGQRERQKAKDINWDTGVVLPVQFRGDAKVWSNNNTTSEKLTQSMQDPIDDTINKKMMLFSSSQQLPVVEEEKIAEDESIVDEDSRDPTEGDTVTYEDSDNDIDDNENSPVRIDSDRRDEKKEPIHLDGHSEDDDDNDSRRSSELIQSSTRHFESHLEPKFPQSTDKILCQSSSEARLTTTSQKVTIKPQDHPAYILLHLQTCKNANLPSSSEVHSHNEFVEPVLKKSPAHGLLGSAHRNLSSIPRPPGLSTLSLSGIQVPPLTSMALTTPDSNDTSHQIGGIARLTPRAPSKKRMHRYRKKVKGKHWADQAELSEGEANDVHRTGLKSATWARHQSTWHQKVLQQSHIDPISIFGCGSRPVRYEEVFHSPDFHRAYNESAAFPHRQQMSAKELISREARAEKKKKWLQDQRQCGFGDHEGVDMYEVCRFRQRIGRTEDVSHLVWDDWVDCDHECDHNSNVRQPWFQKVDKSPYSVTSPATSTGGSRRRIWGSPLPASRCLENVQEEDEENGAVRETSRSPPPYSRGVFFNTIQNKPKPLVPPINLPVLTPKQTSGQKHLQLNELSSRVLRPLPSQRPRPPDQLSHASNNNLLQQPQNCSIIRNQHPGNNTTSSSNHCKSNISISSSPSAPPSASHGVPRHRTVFRPDSSSIRPRDCSSNHLHHQLKHNTSQLRK